LLVGVLPGSAGEKQACMMKKAEEIEAFKRSDCAVMNELTYYL
jgi:hypothetical protein